MRCLLIVVAAVLSGCSSSFAQLTPLTPNRPAMGFTSPLGILGATSAVGPIGIPLGATELTPGGLSPAPFNPTASNAPCVSAGATRPNAYGAPGSASTFDAGSMSTNPISPGGASYGPIGSSGSALPRPGSP